MFPAPPAAESGQVYKTLDARCQACVVMGGQEGPCLSDGELAAIEATTGHPCPRREWPDEEGPGLFALLLLSAKAGAGHLFETYWRIRYGGEPRDFQERMLMRILMARADEEIALSLWPEPEPRTPAEPSEA